MGPGSAPALLGPTLRWPSRLIHAIDPPPVPMVLMSIIGMRTGYAPTAPPLVTCGLPRSIRQRWVGVPPASSAPTSGKPAPSATPAPASAPAAEPDSAVVIGLRST